MCPSPLFFSLHCQRKAALGSKRNKLAPAEGAERDAVLLPGPGQSCALAMAARLQHHKATLEARTADADGLRGNVPPAAGSGAKPRKWPRVCPHRSPRPRGPNQPPERTHGRIETGGNVSCAWRQEERRPEIQGRFTRSLRQPRLACSGPTATISTWHWNGV